jgi:hypothetical protein
MGWWLISDEDARKIKVALESAQETADRECDRQGCLCNINGGPTCGAAYYIDAIHTLDSGLHVTEAVPADFANK